MQKTWQKLFQFVGPAIASGYDQKRPSMTKKRSLSDHRYSEGQKTADDHRHILTMFFMRAVFAAHARSGRGCGHWHAEILVPVGALIVLGMVIWTAPGGSRVAWFNDPDGNGWVLREAPAG